MSANQMNVCCRISCLPHPTGGNGTQVLNAAAKWVAYAFIAPPGDKTVSNINVDVSTIAGTQANLSISCTIYSDVNGVPNSALSSAITLTNLAAGFWSFTGFNYGTTGGIRYWMVFKNTTAVPATDYITLRWGTNREQNLLGSNQIWGCSKHYSADSGSTWTTGTSTVDSYRIDFSDSTYLGTPMYGQANSSSNVYGTARETGVTFTTPPYSSLRIVGACLSVTSSGTPSGSMFYRLRFGSTVASSYVVPPGNFAASSYYFYPLLFPTVQIVPCNTACRLTINDNAVDTSGNNFKLGDIATLQNDATSRGQIHLQGYETYTVDNTANPIVWTDTNTLVPGFTLMLDTVQEFVTLRSPIGLTGGCRG